MKKTSSKKLRKKLAKLSKGTATKRISVKLTKQPRTKLKSKPPKAVKAKGKAPKSAKAIKNAIQVKNLRKRLRETLLLRSRQQLNSFINTTLPAALVRARRTKDSKATAASGVRVIDLTKGMDTGVPVGPASWTLPGQPDTGVQHQCQDHVQDQGQSQGQDQSQEQQVVTETPRFAKFLGSIYNQELLTEVDTLSLAITEREGTTLKYVNHVHPRAHCVARMGPTDAIFAVCVDDNMNRPSVKNNAFVHVCDISALDVKVGDWCLVAHLTRWFLPQQPEPQEITEIPPVGSDDLLRQAEADKAAGLPSTNNPMAGPPEPEPLTICGFCVLKIHPRPVQTFDASVNTGTCG